jgi:lysylphosphatidylglycerol synthetase-like protein (DUF2156 family)
MIRMDMLDDFSSWAWARHHNPLSWYIRPFFVLPFCYFAYKKNWWGIGLTAVAVLSSMFWFPAPATVDAQAAAFLAMERQYIAGPWTAAKIVTASLVPIWFIACAWACWRRSWIGGFVLICAGTLLKVIWSFYFCGDSGWSIVSPAAVGFVVCAGIYWYAYRRMHPAERLLAAPEASSK